MIGNLDNILNTNKHKINYDNKSLIIKNNFIIIIYGFTFILLYNSIIFYIVLSSNTIEWGSEDFFIL